MKMKTGRGKRKVGRRLGLSESSGRGADRRVSLSRPVARGELVRPPEEAPAAEDLARDEGAPAREEEGAPSSGEPD